MSHEQHARIIFAGCTCIPYDTYKNFCIFIYSLKSAYYKLCNGAKIYLPPRRLLQILKLTQKIAAFAFCRLQDYTRPKTVHCSWAKIKFESRKMINCSQNVPFILAMKAYCLQQTQVALTVARPTNDL